LNFNRPFDKYRVSDVGDASDDTAGWRSLSASLPELRTLDASRARNAVDRREPGFADL
jgi:hypothetical protein